MKTEKKSSEPSFIPPPAKVAKESLTSKTDEVDNNRHASIKVEEDCADVNNVIDDNGTDNASDAQIKDPNILDSTKPSNEVVTSIVPTCSTDNQKQTSANQTISNPIKEETDAIINTSNELPNDCATSIGLPNDGIQQLVGNVSKPPMGSTNTTNTGDAQYMQQQSQIFVFSTSMANKGAEMVLQGQFPTIIAYHCAQPSTKKYLERYPNKMQNMRQNPHQWLNNLPPMKQKLNQHMSMSHSFPTEQPPDLPPIDPNASSYWNEPPNIRSLNGRNPMVNAESSIDDTNIDVPCLVPNSPSNSVNPHTLPNLPLGHSPNMMGGTTSPMSGSLQPSSLQGVKVPDEDLTPQQRQHREEQLATIRKMQMMLFPEQKENASGPVDHGGQLNLPPSMCQTNNLPQTGIQNQCPTGIVDWHRMQHPFMDNKNKVGVASPSVPPLRGSGVVTGVPRSQGPPPPYHQTTRSASVPIAIQSPNPGSPNNPTSNLSLPSPRANSALNSPADCNRQFQLGGQRAGGNLPGQSPTNQGSPNNSGVAASASTVRLNHSNPGTPVSHALSALSPSTQQKDPLDFPANQSNIDGMFRSMQSLTQQKQQCLPGGVNPTGVKEPNLMPVPSPQQIQYLNAFDGQELTIQKQPNTSLKDGSSSTNTQSSNNNTEMSGRSILGSNIDSINNNQFGGRSDGGASPSIENNANRSFGALHSPHTPHTPHTPGSVAPHTPIDSGKAGNNKTSAQSSPASHNASLTDSMGPPRTIPASPNTKPDSSPLSKELQQSQQQTNVLQQQLQQHQQLPHQQHQQMPQLQQQNMQGLPTGMHPGNSGLSNQMMGVPGNIPPPFSCNRPPGNSNQGPENVPLNPNNMVNRMSGMGPMQSNNFDPITSLAQMSQQLTNNAANNGMGVENSQMLSGNPNMMPFNHPHNMHMMQMQSQNEMNGCHIGGPPDSTDVAGLCMGLGGPPTSYSPTPHTGSPGINNKLVQQHHTMMQQHGMMPGHPPNPNVSQTGPYGPAGPMSDSQQQQQHGPQSRLLPTGHGQHQLSHGHGPQPGPHHVQGPGNPYNGASVQVKPSAPNTIQYLPARPNVGQAPRGPPSLDFLHRFANPMSAMEAKMPGPPSVNLQYFPNGCIPGGHTGPGGMGPHPGSPGTGMNAGMPAGQRPMDGPIHPSMRQGPNLRQQTTIMRMQHMVGGGVFPGNPMDSEKAFPPDIVSGPPQMPGQYGSSPMQSGKPVVGMQPSLGPTPDTSQPLPPSIGGGGAGFKGSPFMNVGSSMNDPNYLQQFHNFQQQLYATSTRGNGPPLQNMHNQPNSHVQQQFFMPK